MARKSNGSPRGHVPQGDVARWLSMKYRVPTIDLDEFGISPDVVRLVPREVCERLGVIPVSRTSGSLVVAMADPTNETRLETLRSLTGLWIDPVAATPTEIARAIAKYY